MLWLKPPQFRNREIRDHIAMLLDLPVTVRAAAGLPDVPHDGLDLLAHDAQRYSSRDVFMRGSRSGKRFFGRRNAAGNWQLVSFDEVRRRAGRRFRREPSP